MEEMALIIFTIGIQAAVGLMVFAALANYLDKDRAFRVAVVSAAGLAVIGLLASFLHLGQPLRAVNALAHFATSWLSREIWLTSMFTGLTVITALLLLFKPASKSMIQVLMTLAAVLGLLDVYAMASVYTSTSVSAWNYGAVPVEFYTAALSIGAVLFLALGGTKASTIRRPAMIITGIAIVLQVASMVGYYIQLGASSSLAAQQSLSLLSNMNSAMVVKWLFILLGVGLLFFPVQKSISISNSGQAAAEIAAAATSSTTLYLAAALLVIGQIVGRYLFFAIMIVSRIGLS